MSLFRKPKIKKTPQDFWAWFAANKKRLDAIYEDQNVFDEMMHQAQEFNPLIEFLIGKPKNKMVLYISCNGIKAGIPAVEALVTAAPKVPGWDIVAFKQPVSAKEFQTKDDTIRFEDTFEVDAFTATFALEKHGDMHDLTIYSPEERLTDGHKFAYYLLLDMLLGEYFVMTKLAGIQVVPQDNTQRPSLIKLRDYLNFEEQN